MTEALAQALIDIVCDAFANEAYNQMLNSDLHAGGETAVDYGAYIYGNCMYTVCRVSDFSSFTETASFRLSPYTMSDMDVPFIDGEYVKWYVGGEGSASANDLNISVINGNYYLLSSDPGFNFYCTVAGGGGTTLSGQSGSQPVIAQKPVSQYKYWVRTDNASGYLSTTDNNIATISEIKATSLQTVHDSHPNAVYIPVPIGGKITYNEYREEVVNYVNNTWNFNFSVSDAPAFEDIYPVETETEPEEEPFTIDYDEILGEDELESILSQETYNIPEINTELFTEETIPYPSWDPEWDVDLDPSEVYIASELEEVPNFISDAVLSGWGTLHSLGICGLFFGCATVAVIWKIIKNMKNNNGE